MHWKRHRWLTQVPTQYFWAKNQSFSCAASAKNWRTDLKTKLWTWAAASWTICPHRAGFQRPSQASPDLEPSSRGWGSFSSQGTERRPAQSHQCWRNTLKQVCPNQLSSLREQRPLLPHEATLGEDQHPWVKAFSPTGPIRGRKQTPQALHSPTMSVLPISSILLLLQG